jgi:hypothetical protein
MAMLAPLAIKRGETNRAKATSIEDIRRIILRLR